MNNFALVLVMPALLTLGSAATLFFSFKGRVDTSGKYFLLAELLMLLVLILVIATNIYPKFATPTVFYISNLSALMSEVAIFFSIKTLAKKIKFKKFVFVTVPTMLYCVLIEYFRVYLDPKSPVLFLSIFSIAFAIATYEACKTAKNNNLETSLFIKWIAYLELGLTLAHSLRFASYFADNPIVPRNPTTAHILIFSIYLVFNLFRYISYQSLRISWVDPTATNENPLNRSLVKLIKEKNQFLQGLISSNRALGISALANSLAHQLSQPITGVILQTETVKRDLIDLGNQGNSVQTLNSVTEQLVKLSALVTNLRKLFGAQELEFRPFNVQEACDEVLELINPTLEAENIFLKKLYKSNPTVFGNSIQIQQVLINIFNNAIDAIESSGKLPKEVSLIVSNYKAVAVISIQDTGGGIAPNVAPTIFELYQSTKKDGLGIGLWLSKTIIDKHNGEITASNAPQGGAIFEIRIPFAT